MIPSSSLMEAPMKLLAADPATLAPAVDANKVVLVKAPFVPSPQRVLADFTLADFDGSTPLLCGLGTQNEGLDPATNNPVIDLIAPVGGWRWETTGLARLPQQIYGFILVDNAGAVLLACQLLDVPVSLNAVNQRVDLGDLPRFTMLWLSIS